MPGAVAACQMGHWQVMHGQTFRNGTCGMVRDAPVLGAAPGEALALPAQGDGQLVQAQAVHVLLQVCVPARRAGQAQDPYRFESTLPGTPASLVSNVLERSARVYSSFRIQCTHPWETPPPPPPPPGLIGASHALCLSLGHPSSSGHDEQRIFIVAAMFSKASWWCQHLQPCRLPMGQASPVLVHFIYPAHDQPGACPTPSDTMNEVVMPSTYQPV